MCRLLKDLSLLKTCAGGKKTLDNTTAEDKHRLVPVLGTPESLSGHHKRCTQVPRSHLEPDTTTERGCITASVREKKTKTQSSGTRYTRTLTETPRRSQPLRSDPVGPRRLHTPAVRGEALARPSPRGAGLRETRWAGLGLSPADGRFTTLL